MKQKHNYGTAILSAFEYLLENYKETFVIGQGLWSPWYVGNSMTDLDKKFGKNRVIDTPVSESATTGAAVGASIAGMKAKNLPKKPSNGGMPMIENKKIVSTTAKLLFVLDSPARSLIFSTIPSRILI